MPTTSMPSYRSDYSDKKLPTRTKVVMAAVCVGFGIALILASVVPGEADGAGEGGQAAFGATGMAEPMASYHTLSASEGSEPHRTERAYRRASKALPHFDLATDSGRDNLVEEALSSGNSEQEMASDFRTADRDASVGIPETRMVVKNGDLSVAVKNVSVEYKRVVASVTSLGGFVVHSQEASMWNYQMNANVNQMTANLRVPAEHLEAVVDDIKQHSVKMFRYSTSGEDVTEQYIDAATRAASKQALHAKLAELLKASKGVAETLEVHRELEHVTADMEAHKARAEYLQKSAALSTLTLELLEQPPPDAPEEPNSPAAIAYTRALAYWSRLHYLLIDGAIVFIVFVAPVMVISGLVLAVVYHTCGKRLAAAAMTGARLA